MNTPEKSSATSRPVSGSSFTTNDLLNHLRLENQLLLLECQHLRQLSSTVPEVVTGKLSTARANAAIRERQLLASYVEALEKLSDNRSVKALGSSTNASLSSSEKCRRIEAEAQKALEEAKQRQEELEGVLKSLGNMVFAYVEKTKAAAEKQ